MNLKKIAGMCKSAGSFHVTNIVNDDGEVTDQWVILGPAAYRVDNMGLTATMLAPLEGTEYFVRSMEGKPVLAVKNGMFIEAVITPYDAFGEKDGVPLPGLKAALIEATGIWR